MRSGACPTLRGSFTLIEIVVCIAIVALLLAIAAPVLSSARQRSQALRSQSNLRQLRSMIDTYAGQSSGHFPRVIEDKMYSVSPGSRIAYPFWQVDETWIAVLADIFPRWENLEIVYTPRSPALTNRAIISPLTSYRYSWSMVARPEFWDYPQTRRAADSAGVRDFEVRFPSAKAVLWDDECAYLGRRLERAGNDIVEHVPIAFVDGSVSLRRPSDALQAVENPEVNSPNAAKLRNTAHGVHGRDY